MEMEYHLKRQILVFYFIKCKTLPGAVFTCTFLLNFTTRNLQVNLIQKCYKIDLKRRKRNVNKISMYKSKTGGFDPKLTWNVLVAQ